jgi:hypothetical protein
LCSEQTAEPDASAYRAGQSGRAGISARSTLVRAGAAALEWSTAVLLLGSLSNVAALGGQTTSGDAVVSPRLTLARLVDPSARVETNGRVVPFSLHGLIHFETLDEAFAYVDEQAGRWQFSSPADRQVFGDTLLRRAVESRVVSMQTELPLEIVLTHTREQLEDAVSRVRTKDAPLVFAGRNWQLSQPTYAKAFLRVRDRWTTSLNCWSAASSVPARVLSNWFVIEEGIELFGATYDSTEHFWQAVKYHPDITVGEVRAALAALQGVDWRTWMAALDRDQPFYLANAYAVEFLRHNLTPDRLGWFDAELARAAPDDERARTAQQRKPGPPGSPVRFAALQEKVLWGDVADVFHLIVSFTGRPGASTPRDVTAARQTLVSRRFDAIYLAGYAGGRVPFLSDTFQQLMLEIWKVKYLQMPRFAEVIRSTLPYKLDHFLDDGDSPDIPIPVYVGQLNRIRELATAQGRSQ